MKPFLLSFIVFLGTSVTITYGQFENDLQAYRSTNSLERKTELGIKLWGSLIRNELDTLRNIAFELILRGVEEGNDQAVAVGKRSLGTVMIRSGEPDKGIYFLKEALSYFTEKGDLVISTETLNEIGNGYLNKGEPVEAEKYYLRSLKIGRDSPDPTSVFLAEINLGQAYIGMKNFDKASAIIQHYKNEALKHGKLESVANAYALLGTIEQQRKNIPLAMEYFTKSADFGKRSSSIAQQAHALNNMAIVYFEKGETDKTLDLFNQALELRRRTGNARYVCESLYNLAGLYFELGDDTKAEENYLKSLDLAREKKLRKDQMDAIMGLCELYKKRGQQEKTIGLLEEYIELQDAYYSQMASDNTHTTDLIETVKELENKNRLKKKDIELQHLERATQMTWYLVYAIGTLTFLSLVFLYFFRRKGKEITEV